MSDQPKSRPLLDSLAALGLAFLVIALLASVDRVPGAGFRGRLYRLVHSVRKLERPMMRKFLLATCAVCIALPAIAQEHHTTRIKTRLDHLSGTQWVVVLSTLPSEITSITCDGWTMMGVGSWKHHNDFTIPAGPSIAVIDASGFNGYCKGVNSIVAHTDDGDAVGRLDRGPGMWDASTRLDFAQ